MTEPRCQVPSCPDFGDPDFGEATCPSWHADEQASPPVDAVGPSGPVGRSVGEIRADLAHCDRDGVPWPEAARRLLADVPGLLAEVEAAHRFELAAGVEREALLAEVERLREENDGLYQATLIVAAERDSLRGVVQAVRDLELRARQEWAKRDYIGAAVVTAEQLRAALAAAADAPQPEDEARADALMTEAHHAGDHYLLPPVDGCANCQNPEDDDESFVPGEFGPGPSPAVLPEASS